MSRRILFLSDIDSSHTRKWAISLHERKFTVAIFSIRKSITGWFQHYPGIKVYDGDGFSKEKFAGPPARKLDYLRLLPALRKAIAEFNPDIVHAHYATSYGLLGVRTGFHPLIISVWGSDVFEFPRKSILHRYLVKRNLRKADMIFSTSEVMKAEVKRLGRADAIVTPFGVDTRVYSERKSAPMFDSETKVIGTIKTLEKHYGIDILIHAFDKVRADYPGKLKLVICGSGTQESELKMLAGTLGCSTDVVFTGAIPQEEVPEYLNRFDVFANLSLHESFGVAVLEAMACGVPCVISDAPGLKEISGNGKFASMVKVGDVDMAAKAILKLVSDVPAANELKVQARKHAEAKYDWNNTLNQIEQHYQKLLSLK